MRKVVAFALAMITLLSVLVVPVVAAEEATGTYGTDWLYYGDIDTDQVINAKDALVALKYAVGKQNLTPEQAIVADVTKDEVINAKDALDILKLSVGKIASFAAGVFHVFTTVEPEPPVEQDYIASYDKGNSVNGAYVKDTTADTNYKLDITDLAKNTYYKVGTGAWATKNGIADQVDIQRLLFSLQGLVNRDFGMDADHTTAIYVTNGADDTAWLTEMQKEGSIFAAATKDKPESGMNVINVRNWDKFKEYFLPTIKKAGIILWDGKVPATANVAATICGLDGYLPVLAESPLHKTLVANGVPVKQTLVGLFEDGNKGRQIKNTVIQSTGSAKNDAYLWALEKYFSRCSAKYIAYTLDGAPTVSGYSAYEDNPIAKLGDAGANCLSNHDYLIARRCFFFDLDPCKLQAACDDPAQKKGQADIGTDHNTMIKIFERRYERAKGEFGALMGFIPWWLKYTFHHGHSTLTEPNGNNAWFEWYFCEVLTCYNLAKEADAAHPCTMYNGSFMYKYVPNTKQYKNNTKAENISYDPNTYYYTIYVGDYDSSAWLKKHIHEMWIDRKGDKNRGQVSLMWSINPNLSERIPVVFDYMYENKTDKDYFAGGDGGAGYIVPEALFTGRTLTTANFQRPAAYGNGDKTFADYSKTFYDRFDMKMTGFIINTEHRILSKEVAATIASYSPALNFHTCYNNPIAKYGNTYFVYCYNELTAKTLAGNMDGLNHYWNKLMGNRNFGAFRTICWTPTQIKSFVDELNAYYAGQGKTAKYCDPYTYLNMLKAANNAQVLG